MKYRAIFIGGPIDGQERVTEQRVSQLEVINRSEHPVRQILDRVRVDPDLYKTTRYWLAFVYGAKEDTLIYSSLPTTEVTLTKVFETYMAAVCDQGAKCA